MNLIMTVFCNRKYNIYISLTLINSIHKTIRYATITLIFKRYDKRLTCMTDMNVVFHTSVISIYFQPFKSRFRTQFLKSLWNRLPKYLSPFSS